MTKVHSYKTIDNTTSKANKLATNFDKVGKVALKVGKVTIAGAAAVAAGVGVGLQLFSMEFRPTKHFGFTANLASLNFVALASAGSALTFNLGVNPTVGFKYYF